MGQVLVMGITSPQELEKSRKLELKDRKSMFFPTLGLKKFPHPRHKAHLEIVFLHKSTK